MRREFRYDSSAGCRSGTTTTSLISASTGRGGATGTRMPDSEPFLACRSICPSTSLTLSVWKRYFPSSTRSPPFASAKSYHSFSRSLTLNDGVRSALKGERYQYCSDFTYCAWCPICARKSTMRTCFASSIFMSVSLWIIVDRPLLPRTAGFRPALHHNKIACPA